MRGEESIKSSSVSRLTIENIFWHLNERVTINTVKLAHKAGWVKFYICLEIT